MKILSGPFKGTEFQQDQAYGIAGDREGDLPKALIFLAVLTQVWLEKYNPLEGWSTVVTSELMDLNMVPRARENMIVTEHVPCAKFVATLTDPTGRVVASATSVWTIVDPGSWEAGESNARKRLYEAGGLTTKFPLPEGMAISASQPMPVAGIVKPRDPEALPDYTPLVDDADTDAARAAEDPAPVEVDPATAVDQSVTEATPAPAVDAPAAGDAAPAAAPETTASAPAQETVQARSGRGKRERLKDTDPAPQALIDQVTRLARMKGKPVPKMVTKGDATKALHELQA